MLRPQGRPRFAPPVRVPLALAYLLVACALTTAEGKGGGGKGGGSSSSSSHYHHHTHYHYHDHDHHHGSGSVDPIVFVIVIPIIVLVAAIWCCFKYAMLTGVDPERSYPREDQESTRRLLFDQGSSYENRDAAALRFPVTHGGLKDVANLIRARLHMSNGAPQLGGGIPEAVPPSGRYIGKYEERGEVKWVNYDLQFWKDGSVCGSCSDDDGAFQVKGVFDTKSEIYRWGETMTGASYTKWENSPSLYESAVVSGKHFHVEVLMRYEGKTPARLTGEYLASTGMTGSLSVTKA